MSVRSVKISIAVPVLAALVLLAGCPGRTRVVGGGEPAPPRLPEPPAIGVSPLSVAELVREPERGLVLGAGGPGRARPVPLIGRTHWIDVAAPLAEETGWGSFWLIARPKHVGPPRNPILPPVRPLPAPVPEPDPTTPGSETTPDAGAAPVLPPAPPVGPAFAGPAWNRTLWTARLAATGAVGKNPLDVELAAISKGAAVEPPHAATLAVAAMAALTGASLSRTAAVIAELEPDGSLAPVRDPVAEVQAALRRGARRVVLPTGGGTAAPSRDARPVDLVEMIRRAGGTAWVAPDLIGAYRALASAPLAEPEAVDPKALALTEDERAAVEAAYRRALERVAPGWPKLLELQNRARLPTPFAALVAAAERGIRRAERLRAAGHSAAAYVRLTDAAPLADAAGRLDQILRLVAEGEMSRARSELDAAAAPPDPVPWIPSEESAPETIDSHVRAGSLFMAAAATWAWSEEADARAKEARSVLDSPSAAERSRPWERSLARRIADGVTPLLVAAARARTQADLAQDRAGLEPRGGPTFTADPDLLRSLAAANSTATTALLESVLPSPPDADPSPSEAGSPPAPTSDSPSGSGSESGSASASGSGSASRSDLPSSTAFLPKLIIARHIASLVEPDGTLRRVSGRPRVPTERAPLLALFAAQHAFDDVMNAFGRTRRLRLRIQPWTGETLAVDRASRLRVALTLAERAARRQAASAQVAIGSIPLGARLAYQAAAALARGELAERVSALELYQSASAECRLAVLLALSETAAPTSASGSAGARAECRPSPSGPRVCR